MSSGDGVGNKVSEIGNVSMDDKCVSDRSSFEDLGEAVVDSNVDVTVSGNGIGKDDPDGSYVFISRCDSANDHLPVGSDLIVEEKSHAPECVITSEDKDVEVNLGDLTIQNDESVQLGLEEENCINKESDVLEVQVGDLAYQNDGTVQLGLEDNFNSKNSDDAEEVALVKPGCADLEVARSNALEEQNKAVHADPGSEHIDVEVKVEEQDQESPVLIQAPGDCESLEANDVDIKSQELHNSKSTAELEENVGVQVGDLTSQNAENVQFRLESDDVATECLPVASDCIELEVARSDAVEEHKETTPVDLETLPVDLVVKLEEIESNKEASVMPLASTSGDCKSQPPTLNDSNINLEELNDVKPATFQEGQESQIMVSNVGAPDDGWMANKDKNELEPTMEDGNSDESQQILEAANSGESAGLDSTVELTKSKEYQIAIPAEVENEDIKSEEQTKSQLAMEVEENTIVETAEPKFCELDSGEEKPEEVDTTASITEKESMGSEKVITDTVGLDQGEELAILVDQTNIQLETEAVNNHVIDANKDMLPSCGEDSNLQVEVPKPSADDIQKSPDFSDSLENGKICPRLEIEVENGQIEDLPTGAIDHVKVSTEDGNSVVKNRDTALSFPLIDAKSEREDENAPTGGDKLSCLGNGVGAENLIAPSSVDAETEVQSLQRDDVNTESKVSNDAKSECDVENDPSNGDKLSCQGNGLGAENVIAHSLVDAEIEVQSLQCDDVNIESEVSNDAKSESEVENAPSSGDKLSFQDNSLGSENVIAPSSVDAEIEVQSLQCDDVKIESEVSNDAKLESEVEIVPTSGDILSCQGNGVGAENVIAPSSADAEIEVQSLPCDVVNIEPEVSNGSAQGGCLDSIPVNSVNEVGPENHVFDKLENGGSTEAKIEAEDESSSMTKSGETPDIGPNQSKSEIHDGSTSECQETEDIEGVQRDGTTTSSPESSAVDAPDGLNVVDSGKRAPTLLIRVPRYDDEELREQIRHAQLQVDEKTQHRDTIRVETQRQREICQDYLEHYKTVKSEERAARGLVRLKRQELESVQSVSNKVKNATSIEEIDGRINNMEHMIGHQTLPLKEEKQLVREINQLKHLREQLTKNMGSQDEVQQALEQKDQIEDRLKILKKELYHLKDNVGKAEATVEAAEKKYKEENDKLRKLQAQFGAADDVRQKAYAHLQSLRKQLYEKNKYFRMYKDQSAAANGHALSGDREALHRICNNQVEAIMEQWNNDEDFRKEYMRCNRRSTLRRLRTLDGRSLGPDEEPPMMTNVVANERVGNSLASPGKAHSVEPETINLPVERAVDVKSTAKVNEEQKVQKAEVKKPVKTVVENVSAATVSTRDEPEETIEEESRETKEEKELVRKAEELRKQEAEAKLREQRKLEEKAKAKEALERKKRMAEKAQIKAQLRAQKEAEQKEKEKEKRARKKEKKKADAVEAPAVDDGLSAPAASETPTIHTNRNLEVEDIPKKTVTTKRPPKLSAFLKSNKKSVPLPLRNRGKRRMQAWMWAVLVALVVVALFLLGNAGGGFSSILGSVF